MCSFDILSLFTNVPLEEIINICAGALYCDDSDAQPFISKAVFIELIKSATSGVEFSFNDIMYKQTDGVAMGSPLGPALANICSLSCMRLRFEINSSKKCLINIRAKYLNYKSQNKTRKF